MAKQIIALDSNVNDGGQFTLSVVFWFPVAAGKENPIPSLTKSAWSSASGAEVSALQAGTVIEEVKTYSFPKTYTTAQIKSALQSYYADRSAYLASLPFKGQYYGIFFDGSVWSA